MAVVIKYVCDNPHCEDEFKVEEEPEVYCAVCEEILKDFHHTYQDQANELALEFVERMDEQKLAHFAKRTPARAGKQNRASRDGVPSITPRSGRLH